MSDQPYQKWICDACGFIYDEAKGDPDSGLAPGTRYADIPDDWQCPLCGLAKGDLRLLPEPVSAPAPAAPRAAGGRGRTRGGPEAVVIVGAGVAGWSVAEAVRARDPERPVVLVTACEGHVYPKPALSMALAQGKLPDDLIEHDADTRAAELGIQVLTRTRVIKLDTTRKRLVTARGGIEYGRLVLATGARQRELPVTGDGEVLRVNDLGSYRRLRDGLAAGVEHVTILGAGLIGCEFAEDLSGAGYRVTVVDPMAGPLASLVPEPMAEELRERLRAKGVEWRLGTVLEGLQREDGSYRARLADGATFTTDLVVSAAGLVPNTDLARKAGLTVDTGIAVDANLCASAEGVYAIGDCAAVEGRVYAYIEPIRRQAAAIAAHCCGDPAPFVPLPPLVRVKTPTMPIAVCAASPARPEAWTMVSHGADGCRMDHRVDGTLDGFALCGDLVNASMGLYRELYAG